MCLLFYGFDIPGVFIPVDFLSIGFGTCLVGEVCCVYVIAWWMGMR